MRKFLFALGCLFTSLIYADVYQLNSLLQSFTSLQANFTQVIIDNQGNQNHSTGILYIQKPNQFHFEVISPNAELFISNGEQVWSVEPDLQQVTISPLSQNLSTTPLLLLSGSAKDVQSIFTVDQVNATNYILTPKQSDSMIKQIIISFDATGLISYLQITNTIGQLSKLSFSNVLINQTLAPTVFTYVPPAGMSVLQQ